MQNSGMFHIKGKPLSFAHCQKCIKWIFTSVQINNNYWILKNKNKNGIYTIGKNLAPPNLFFKTYSEKFLECTPGSLA